TAQGQGRKKVGHYCVACLWKTYGEMLYPQLTVRNYLCKMCMGVCSCEACPGEKQQSGAVKNVGGSVECKRREHDWYTMFTEDKRNRGNYYDLKLVGMPDVVAVSSVYPQDHQVQDVDVAARDSSAAETGATGATGTGTGRQQLKRKAGDVGVVPMDVDGSHAERDVRGRGDGPEQNKRIRPSSSENSVTASGKTTLPCAPAPGVPLARTSSSSSSSAAPNRGSTFESERGGSGPGGAGAKVSPAVAYARPPHPTITPANGVSAAPAPVYEDDRTVDSSTRPVGGQRQQQAKGSGGQRTVVLSTSGGQHVRVTAHVPP
ncbi:hypothetical protein HK102_010636, partial [Quaeritorhiza haematococci]